MNTTQGWEFCQLEEEDSSGSEGSESDQDDQGGRGGLCRAAVPTKNMVNSSTPYGEFIPFVFDKKRNSFIIVWTRLVRQNLVGMQGGFKQYLRRGFCPTRRRQKYCLFASIIEQVRCSSLAELIPFPPPLKPLTESHHSVTNNKRYSTMQCLKT